MKPYLHNGEWIMPSRTSRRNGMEEALICRIEAWGAAIGIGATAGAIAGTGALAAAGSVASSAISGNAQKSAANSAAQSQQNANNLNYQQFLLSRGSGGNAVLPMYLTTPGGAPWEGQLGQDLIGAYDQSSVPLSSFSTAVAPSVNAQQGANRLTTSLFNGGVTRQMQRNAAPVEAARTSVARTSAEDALSKTLAAIDAEQAGRGYSGDSLSNRLLAFQGRNIEGQQLGQANLQNLQEQADIKNYGDITLPLQNINLPVTNAQNAGALSFMPQADWLNSINQRIQPFNFLRIGQSTPFTYQPLPVFNTGGGTGGAIAGGISQLGGGLMQYYQQQAQNQNVMNLLKSLQTNQPQPQSMQNSADLSNFLVATQGGTMNPGSVAGASPSVFASDLSGTDMFSGVE